MTRGVSVHAAGVVYIYRAEGHDVAALAGIDLDVASAGTLALLGPSGAGKSTLLSLIAGLDRPTAGTITVDGQRIDQLDSRDLDRWRGTKLALVLQGGTANLIPHLTLRENVELARAGAGGDLPPLDELLAWVGIDSDSAERLPRDVSPARAQLTALCVGIAAGPGLLLADEPTASLRAGEADQVIAALHRINGELGTTVLTVTHDPKLASAMQRTVTIRDGRVGGQAHDGIELAVVAPDGSLPLPDSLLEAWPAGTEVLVEHDEEETENPSIVIKRLEQRP